MSHALIVVDVQNDFCEGGALAVAGGNDVAERIADYVVLEGGQYTAIFYTKDWHKAPPDTNGGHFGDPPDFVDSWPVHCVADSRGSEFHPEISQMLRSNKRFRQGYDVFYKGHGKPDYSGFQGENLYSMSLEEALHRARVTEVDVVGLAGDYCVKATALDAKGLGMKVTILDKMVASVGGEEATKKALQTLDEA